ncbi:MAG: PsiF family protein [Rhodocyclaceae bacterium]
MKARIALLALALSLAAAGAFAADEVKKEASPAQKAQQDKMRACNADAGEQKLKGDERKQFMSGCLGAKAAPATQQGKMKECNADAGEKKLKGDERKKFMSECLKGDKK